MLLTGGAPQEAQQTASLATDPEAEPEPQFRRQEVDYPGPEAPRTIVIDTPDKFLFLIEPHGKALRYGIGVGRPGFEWAGVKRISRKTEWPDWTPPPQILLRRPDLPRHMDGGPDNPLGARALYLGSSLYRIHGTNEPSTIGHNVSSGCIRMMNEDVIDLYGRVPVRREGGRALTTRRSPRGSGRADLSLEDFRRRRSRRRRQRTIRPSRRRRSNRPIGRNWRPGPPARRRRSPGSRRCWRRRLSRRRSSC
jgi:L,D-transpeptidase catalytic domain